MSITKGAMLISNANAVGTELVIQLGGTGYKPVEWADKINLLGINSVDAPYAIKSIQAGTYTGEERGAIRYSNCNAVGSMLNKKLNTDRGFKPVEWPSAIKVLKALAENTVTGDICNVSDGADTVPIKSWEVEIAPTLDGVSSVGAVQTGANLLFNNIEDGTTGGIGYTKQSDGSIACSGTVSNVNATRLINTVVLPVGNYVLSGADSSINLRAVLYDSEGAVITNRNDTGSGVTISVDNTVSQIEVRIKARTNAEQVSTTISPMLAVGSTPQTYEKYNGTTHTANLGRTIYGGTVDVVKGEGESSYKIITVGNSGWNYYSAGGYIYRDFSDKVIPEIGDSDHVLVTDNPDMPYGGVNYASQFQDLHIYQAHNPAIYIKDTSCTSLNDFYTKYYNMKIGYELATPTDFTFTPITPTPETALGVNNFWNDTGSNTITYYQAPTALTRSTVSGSIASFSDADTRLTCVNAIATIPPSISGVDTVQLVRMGKNLFNKATVTANTWIIVNSTDTESTVGYITSDYIPVKANTKYYVTAKASNRSAYYDRNKNGISYFSFSGGASFTALYDGYIRITIKNDVDLDTFIINEGDTQETYEAYNATTYTANLPSTNYGGSVDFVNGVVHSARIKKTVRWGDLGNVTQLTDVTRKEIVLSASEEPKYITSSASTDLLNDKNLPYDMTYSGNFEHIYIANSTRIWIYLANGTDADTEITISYTLTDALQTDFTITGQAIIPKTGTNNCYNNVGGNTEITYFTNT